MTGDRTVDTWRGIAKGDQVKVEGLRQKFIFQHARMDGDDTLWVTVSYDKSSNRSGIRVFTPDKIIDLSMVL